MSRTAPTSNSERTAAPSAGRWKQTLIGVVKYGISLSILGYLFYKASRDQSFSDLYEQPKQWGMLALAFGSALSAVMLTIVRWYMLVRSLNMPFQLSNAFRLGFVGYLFNFLTLGVVGGDLLKAIFIARQQPGRHAEAIASVVVDRVIGLYALFLLGAVSFLFVDLQATSVRDPKQLEFIQLICRVTFGCTIAGAVGFGILLLPGFTTAPFWDALTQLPRVGGTIEKLIGALRMYRRQPRLLAIALVMSLGTHTLFVMSIYLIALGLPGNEPSLATHFVIVPIANVAGAIPLPGGMGPFEYTLDLVYRGVSSVAVAPRQGFVIALAFRVITLLIAMVGVVYYLTSRREVGELLKEAGQDTSAASSEEIPHDAAPEHGEASRHEYVAETQSSDG